MKDIVLMCEGERVKEDDFLYVYDKYFTIQRFEKLINNRRRYGYFNFKEYKFDIIDSSLLTKFRGKRKYKTRCEVTDQVKYDYRGAPQSLVKKYYVNGKHVTIDNICNLTGLNIYTIRKRLLTTKSITINNIPILCKLFVPDYYIVTDIEEEEEIKIYDLDKVAEHVGAHVSTVRIVINKGSSTKGFKIQKIMKEV